MFAALDAELFKACFLAWVSDLRNDNAEIIAIDGKGIVTLTFVRQPEVRDDFAAHITLRFGRTCPAARH